MDVFDIMTKKITFAKKDARLAEYTTFGIGGRCRLLALPTNEDEICKTIDFCHQNDVSYYIIGNGSNLLVSDEGFDGVVIRLDSHFADVWTKGNHVFAKAGASAKKIYNVCLANNLGGLEFLATLPASAGGAVVMNAGCFGSEVKDVVARVWATDGFATKLFEINDLAFGYRSSPFADNRLVVTQVEFVAKNSVKQDVQNNYAKLVEQKRRMQPLEYKSAGCIFKKVDGVSAGYYIDKCGLKGLRVGGAEVSSKHAGFIVNRGGATCKDVLTLVDIVYTKCKDTFGVSLVPEVELLGSTDDIRRLSYTYRVQSRQR